MLESQTVEGFDLGWKLGGILGGVRWDLSGIEMEFR